MTVQIQQQIMQELQGIPEPKLLEIYDLIHYFKLGLLKEVAKQVDEDLKIDPEICLKTLEKIKQGEFSEFTEIKNIEVHVQNLKDEIS